METLLKLVRWTLLGLALAGAVPRFVMAQTCGACAPPCPIVDDETAMFTIAGGGDLMAGDCGLYRQHRLQADPLDLYFDAELGVEHVDEPAMEVPPYPDRAVTFKTTGGLTFRNPVSADVEYYETEVPSPFTPDQMRVYEVFAESFVDSDPPMFEGPVYWRQLPGAQSVSCPGDGRCTATADLSRLPFLSTFAAQPALIEITAPLPGAAFNATTIDVDGSIVFYDIRNGLRLTPSGSTAAMFAVTVNGVTATVSADETFHATGVPLMYEGSNLLVAEAVGPSLDVSRSEVSVLRDTEPPVVVATVPDEGAGTTDGSSPVVIWFQDASEVIDVLVEDVTWNYGTDLVVTNYPDRIEMIPLTGVWVPGINTFDFTLEDVLGNSAPVHFEFDYVVQIRVKGEVRSANCLGPSGFKLSTAWRSRRSAARRCPR